MQSRKIILKPFLNKINWGGGNYY